MRYCDHIRTLSSVSETIAISQFVIDTSGQQPCPGEVLLLHGNSRVVSIRPMRFSGLSLFIKAKSHEKSGTLTAVVLH